MRSPGRKLNRGYRAPLTNSRVELAVILRWRIFFLVVLQHTTLGEEKGVAWMPRPLRERGTLSPYAFLTVDS